MAVRSEKQNVTYQGRDYVCTIKHFAGADGKPGVGWLYSARDAQGPVKDLVLLDRLRRILAVA